MRTAYMESRIICTEIWRSTDFRKLDHLSRNVVLFLLTNDKIPVLPVYQIPFDEICFFCNITEKKLIELIPDLRKFGIYFIEEHFVITNKFTRAKYSGGKTEEKRKRLYSSLPTVLQDLIDIEGDIDQSLGNVLGNDWANQPSINHKSIINNHKSITINQKSKTEFSSFEDLTDEVCQEIANQYQRTLQEVLDVRMDMEVWMGKTSKNKYSNYKLALMKWVRDSNKQTSNNFKRKGGYAEITDF
jgi:hypothetical protein